MKKLFHTTCALAALSILVANASETDAAQYHSFANKQVNTLDYSTKLAKEDEDQFMLNGSHQIDFNKTDLADMNGPVLDIAIQSDADGFKIRFVGLTLYRSPKSIFQLTEN